MTRTCNKCHKEKPISDFGARKSRPSGYQYHCRVCANLLAKQWRANNPERVREVHRAFYSRNTARVIQQKVAYNKRQMLADPEFRRKMKARNRLRKEVGAGRIQKPSTCQVCNEAHPKWRIQGHHYAGYEAWNKVQWVCKRCHVQLDAQQRATA